MVAHLVALILVVCPASSYEVVDATLVEGGMVVARR